jgi:hypothetical protein
MDFLMPFDDLRSRCEIYEQSLADKYLREAQQQLDRLKKGARSILSERFSCLPAGRQ